jgi:hypothetical protein
MFINIFVTKKQDTACLPLSFLQRLVAGGRWLVAGGWWLAAGGWRLAAGGWRLVAGSCHRQCAGARLLIPAILAGLRVAGTAHAYSVAFHFSSPSSPAAPS